MTTEEKNKALQMKHNGVGIREVEKVLKVKVSTLQSLYERSDDTDVYFVCPWCGKETINKRARGRPKKFCSRKCAVRYKSAHRPHSSVHVCKCCGKKYKQLVGKKTLFCSRECYLIHRYGNKRIHDPNP